MVHYSEMKSVLDQVSPSFCLAKWTQVTLHLESGTTHSCHHPMVHKVPLSELADNPSALHNTSKKLEARREMIAGKRPPECDYCWRIEDLKNGQISDRFQKSAESWSQKDLAAVVNDPFNLQHRPRYVEVSFSRACNFKCSYCSADFSTKWDEEIKKWGDYPTGNCKSAYEFYDDEENPYVQAFWKWWPDIRDHLHTFRITGGEPLLSPSTFRTLESLANGEKCPQLHLGINSNMGVATPIVDRLVKLMKEIDAGQKVADLRLYASIDAFGPRAEYIRHGLDVDRFWHNIDRVLKEVPSLSITFMCTFNALSITSFKDLLDKMGELFVNHRTEKRPKPIFLDISYLRAPDYQSVFGLPEEYTHQVEALVEYLGSFRERYRHIGPGFGDHQRGRLTRILELMKQGVSPAEKKRLRGRFYQFFNEHDRRRGTNFLKTFPEMEEFWLLCQEAAR